MKIHFNDYEYLLSAISDAQIVTDDNAGSSEAVKSVIFRIVKNEDNSFNLSLLGQNLVLIFRKNIPAGKFAISLDENDNAPFDANGILSFAINTRELISFLNTYKSSQTTYVEGVSFLTNFDAKGNCKVTCMVYETENSDDKSEEEKYDDMLGLMFDEDESESKDTEKKRYRSQWIFNAAQMTKTMKDSINIQPDTNCELEEVNSMAMHAITSSLLPLLSTETNLYSYLNFNALPQKEGDAPAMAIAFEKSFTTFLANYVEGDIFSNIRLNYKAVNFIDKIVVSDHSEGASFKAQKQDKYIYLVWGSNDDCEVFITYDTKLTPYQQLLAARSKDYSFSINRFSLKDVIKRLNLVNDSADVEINSEGNYLKFSNSKFEQILPFTSQTNLENIENNKFRIKPDIFNRVVIGDDRDSEIEDDIVIYINPNNALLTFTTESEFWMSLVKVLLKK